MLDYLKTSKEFILHGARPRVEFDDLVTTSNFGACWGDLYDPERRR